MSEWKECKISEVVLSANTGLDAIKRAPIVDKDTGIKCLRIQDVSQCKEYAQWGFTDVEPRNFDKFQLKRNDIIIARTGATIGVNLIIKNNIQSVFNNGLIRVRVNESLCDAIFLYYNFRTTNYYGFIESISGGTSTQPNMQINALLSYEISLPALSEQRAIASILSCLDDKIDLLHRQNATLEKMAETLFRQWFVEEAIVQSENQILLGDLIESVSITHKFPNNNVVFLNTSDIYLGNVLVHDPIDVKTLPGQAKKTIKKDDILFSEIRPANGRWAYIDFEADNYVVSTKLMVLRSKCKINQAFIYFYLTNSEVVNWLQMIAESRSGTFPQITFDQLKDLVINVPSNEILEFATSWCELTLNKIKSNQNQIRTLIALRDTLLPKLMSGEVRVEN